MKGDFKEALIALERERDISSRVILDAIGKSLVSAFEKQYKSKNNIHEIIDYDNLKAEIEFIYKRGGNYTFKETN